MKIVLYERYTPKLEIQFDGVRASSKVLTPNLGLGVEIKCSELMPNKINANNVMHWLESRCPDRDRADIDYLLRANGIREYHPVWICKKSHGLTMSDNIWLKFDDEAIDYDSIKLRE